MRRIEGMLGSIRDESASTVFVGADLTDVRIRAAPAWLQSLWPAGTNALTIQRTIFFHPDVEVEWTDENLHRLLAHELTHVRQFRRMGFGSFIIRYTFDYLRGRRRGLGHSAAYSAIEFEVEARDAEQQATREG